ncbi:hypothetical protein N7537_001323 [Penicillium hordei]|uniref:Uncharacterized protein n=1 Tax=Penicillium hordei TaxID=40994 RepID=A0AAD6EGF6_9EURO|nr:uncharacterized protein N7537_001323 [Penicillium hordei]KAJ5616209.1 hypothetical protein N7537_001323 [Penicillium hordei]
MGEAKKSEVKEVAVACPGSSHRLRAQSATPTMSNPDLKALDIESSWNQIIWTISDCFLLITTNQTPSTKSLDQTPISSIGSGITPTLRPENSTVNTRPPRALSQSQK